MKPDWPGSTDSERFGQEVAARRRSLELTQDELAQRAGLTRQTISLVECGRENPTLTTVTALARALGCSSFDLFQEDSL